MKRDWKHRNFWAAAGLIAIAANPLTWQGPKARAQAPVEWCDTYEHWVAEAGNQPAAAQGACPTLGTCDTPPVRDSWIPAPFTPIVTLRIQFHVFCRTDGSNCAASASDVAAQMTQLNLDYAPHRIHFTEAAAAEFHHNSTYRFLDYSEIDPMKQAYADDPAHQLNVFVADLPEGLLGRGTFPWRTIALTNTGGIIIDASGAFGAGQRILTHEVGHNLGLYHTHRGVCEVCQSFGECPCQTCTACYERADGVDGDITGDFASDTPPTPTNIHCTDPTGSDACSVPPRPWAPTQTQNYMSNGLNECWTLFTPQQAGRMHCWLHDVLRGWLVCAAAEECDDGNDCTQDACVAGECQYSVLADDTPCAAGVCLCGVPSAAEVPNSTCRDGMDNDCDGYADCNDVVDCGSDPACFCSDNNGNSPLVCVN